MWGKVGHPAKIEKSLLNYWKILAFLNYKLDKIKLCLFFLSYIIVHLYLQISTSYNTT